MEKKNRVTIKDVAKEAGVSISTVSKALNRVEGVTDETREAIENIARKMNYVPNLMGIQIELVVHILTLLLMKSLMNQNNMVII